MVAGDAEFKVMDNKPEKSEQDYIRAFCEFVAGEMKIDRSAKKSPMSDEEYLKLVEACIKEPLDRSSPAEKEVKP